MPTMYEIVNSLKMQFTNIGVFMCSFLWTRQLARVFDFELMRYNVTEPQVALMCLVFLVVGTTVRLINKE